MSGRARAGRAFLLLAATLLLTAAAAGEAAVEVPYLSGRVVDTAEVLSPDASERLTALLKGHEERTSNQVAVLTLRSLEGESIEDFAERVFQAWRLGQAGRDNGVLVAIAVDDRRMRIEVGYGLEDTLTDLAAGRIIRNVMTPRFREGDYDGGVEAGAQAVIAALEGTGEPPGETAAAVAEPKPSAFHFEGPDMSILERVLMGAFVFGIIGLFTVLGVVTPSGGWFIYPFLIPFWATFPLLVIGVKGTVVLLAAYLLGFPIAKLLVSRASWYGKARKEMKTKGRARIGGFTFGGSSGSGSSSHSWSSGSSSFSGGGGSSGGGGASGSW